MAGEAASYEVEAANRTAAKKDGTQSPECLPTTWKIQRSSFSRAESCNIESETLNSVATSATDSLVLWSTSAKLPPLDGFDPDGDLVKDAYHDVGMTPADNTSRVCKKRAHRVSANDSLCESAACLEKEPCKATKIEFATTPALQFFQDRDDLLTTASRAWVGAGDLPTDTLGVKSGIFDLMVGTKLSTPRRASITTAQRKRWHLSPPPPARSFLSPLIGGVEQLAAQCADAQQRSEKSSVLFPTKPTDDQDDQDPAIPSSLLVETHGASASLAAPCDDSFGHEAVTFQCGRLPVSKAAQALVALSVAAAEQDDLALEPRLVDLCTGMVHTLPNDGVVAIGQCAGCDIIVPFPVVDTRHCVLVSTDGCVVVEEVGSKGTFVNEMLVPKGDFLPQRIPLRRGDTLALSHIDGPKFLFLNGRTPSSSTCI
jgi:hypothetical protein